MIGDNSILFEFYSIVDKELSALLYIFDNEEYFKAVDVFDFNQIDRFKSLSINDLKKERMYGCVDIFKSIIKDKNQNHRVLLNYFYDRYGLEILQKKYMVFTDITKLISAYTKVADGIIRSTVLCENVVQKNVVDNFIMQVKTILTSSRLSVDTNNYARIVVGDFYDATKYIIDKPNSIMVMNFRDNFEDDDISNLIPELVISLGDISNISIYTAYDILHGQKIEG